MLPQSTWDTLEQKAVETSRFVQAWDTLYQEVQRLFGPERADELDELHQAARSLHQAETTLLDALRCPMLTLATAGTTSGGKSTLVNMLCGAEIMPTAAGEMSAGVVQIDHHPTRWHLRIKATRGATWECGEWFNLSDDDIRQRLASLAHAYNEVREEVNEPDCPQVELTYPMRLANADILRLPAGFKFRILDLPGLRRTADESNSEIIRRCREALCFVTYNSAEPNKNLQERLLEEVVALVKELGGTPARMIFVLNKIDVFHNDRNWPESENEFVTEMSGKITDALQQAFPEQMEEVSHLNILRLSSLSGLYALLLRRPAPFSDALQRRIGLMKSLLSEETMEALYVPPKVWDERRRELMAQDFEKAAYADVFIDSLRDHINTHLPYLVIPQALDVFVTTGAQPAMLALSQLVTEQINWIEQSVTSHCEPARDDARSLLILRSTRHNIQVLSMVLDTLKAQISLDSISAYNDIYNLLQPLLGQLQIVIVGLIVPALSLQELDIRAVQQGQLLPLTVAQITSLFDAAVYFQCFTPADAGRTEQQMRMGQCENVDTYLDMYVRLETQDAPALFEQKTRWAIRKHLTRSGALPCYLSAVRCLLSTDHLQAFRRI